MVTKLLAKLNVPVKSIALKRLSLTLIGCSLVLGLGSLLQQSRMSAAQTWKMPWPASATGIVNQTWHVDSYGVPALDIVNLNVGSPVLAPVDSTVISQCNAGNNHRAIKLKSADGQIYSLIHVTTSNIAVGKTYKQGEQIGVIAGDKPWNNCARSTGPHLHFGLPSKNFTIDGYSFNARYPWLKMSLKSSNGATSGSYAFASPVSSKLSITVPTVDLVVNASNLPGKTVYVQMWRDAANGYPAKEWNYSKQATSTSISFTDMEGPGNSFAGVTYYTVASLNPIAPGEAAKRRTACYSVTGGKQLCDAIRR